MATYPFTEREQEAIRQIGRAGFRYEHETNKEILFVDSNDRRVAFNRKNDTVSLNLSFSDEATVKALPGVTDTGTSSSSNLKGFEPGPTSRDGFQKQGTRAFLSSITDIEPVLRALR